MATIEIDRSKWIDFFNAFSKEHKGWPVTVEVIGEDIGAQIEARQLPFEGISADLKDKENRIEIAVGGHPEASVTRGITEPVGVWLKKADDGIDEALEIKTASGQMTLVRLLSATEYIS